MMNKLLVLSIFLIVLGCGPSARCQEECKEAVGKFGCECQCDPFWECGQFESGE